jgi:hypothetical protein
MSNGKGETKEVRRETKNQKVSFRPKGEILVLYYSDFSVEDSFEMTFNAYSKV